MLGALPAVAAGLFVLSISNVGRDVWLVQAVAIVMMLVVATGLARALRWGRRWAWAAMAAPGCLALVLACQPDLAQVLAIAVAGLVIIASCCLPWSRRLLLLLPFAAAVGLAAARETPLAPVSYVEQSLRVSWAHSLPAGLGVSMAALAFLAVVAVRLSRIDRSLVAVAAYYAVLFACSLADLTPAPLIGYGSGHLLGFGLLVGTVSLLARGTGEG